eukprot:Em0011g495a
MATVTDPENTTGMEAEFRQLEGEWKRIQKKTFTRWCNERLKVQNMQIDDLATDLTDGVKLIVLLEVLSQKPFGKYNKKARIHAQRMENIDMALDFITRKEKVRLVNIGSADIASGNLKLILGLIWTLILKYQISVGFAISDPSAPKVEGPSPKQALLSYVQGKLPEKSVANLTTAWNDGRLIAALVDAIAPGLCPEHEEMNPEKSFENAAYAMKLAEDWLGVPQVLMPEDMVNPSIDELSMMTYLSQFPGAKLKPGAPIHSAKRQPDPSKVLVYGPGVQSNGLDTSLPSAKFTVDTRETGHGKVAVKCIGPAGRVDVVVSDNKDGTYSCSYIPAVDGDYTLDVLFNDKIAHGSPFVVHVSPGSDALACTARGPGVERSDLKEGIPTEFWVETMGAGQGTLAITIRGPKGPFNTSDIEIEEESDIYHVTYRPQHPGPHTVEVTFNGLQIQNSPFRVHVNADRPDASKCHAEGPGLEENSVEINKETWFDVSTAGAGQGELSVSIRSSRGPVSMRCVETQPGLYRYIYTPTESGEHVITIKYGGDQIPGSRFRVHVEPETDPTKCTAFGQGLATQGVRVNHPAKFTVRTKDAGLGNMTAVIRGPSGEIPLSLQTSPYTYQYSYLPSEPGNYKVDIQFAGTHIAGSPFHVAVTDTSKVTIKGPGMNGECLPVNIPLRYHIDAKGAGPGKVACTVQTPTQQLQGSDSTDSSGPVITDKEDGTFEVVYVPTNPGLQKMNVTFGEAAIPDTPLKLSIFDASKVIAYGPGLKSGNKSGALTSFTVDMRQAGDGHLKVQMSGPANTPVVIKDQANNISKCEFTPHLPGDYKVDILFEDTRIPGSPVKITVQPSTDTSAVRAYGPGLEQGLTTGMWAEFYVDYRHAGEGDLHVAVQGPRGGEALEEEQIENGLKKFQYYIDPDEAGDYQVDVEFADQPIVGSPFSVNVQWSMDPSRVKAYGSGLEGGICNDWAEFTIDMSRAGEGSLNLEIGGPCEAKVEVDELPNGTARVRYLPLEPGEYKINIYFAEKAIPGSPFHPVFEAIADASKCTAYGPGLQHDGVKVGDPGEFTIDTRAAGTGAVEVTIDNLTNPMTGLQSNASHGSLSSLSRRGRSSSFVAFAKPRITNNNNGTYAVVYNPHKVGTFLLHVWFGEMEITGSPFEVNITDPTRVQLSGPGVDSGDEATIIPLSTPLKWVADTMQAGPGALEAYIQDHTGDTRKLELVQTEEGVYSIDYKAETATRYKLIIKLSGNEVKQSPIEFSLTDSSQVKVSGTGLRGGKVGESMTFNIDLRDAGEGSLSLSLTGPVETALQCENHDDGTATLTFVPTEGGEYELDVKFADVSVPGSEFVIPITDISKVRASGSGVTGAGAQVGVPAQVVVDTHEAGPGLVDVSLVGPSGDVTKVELVEKDGVHTGSYVPKVSGYYGLSIRFSGEEILHSPFRVPVCDPTVVELSGSGLRFAVLGGDNTIDVCTRGSGPGELVCTFAGDAGAPPMEATITKLDDSHCQIHYTPRVIGTYKANFKYGGLAVGTAADVFCCDPTKCKIEGLPAESLIVNHPFDFTVDNREAGEGMLEVSIAMEKGAEVPYKVTRQLPQREKVTFTPVEPGICLIQVKYSGQSVEDSPYCVEVSDPYSVRVYGDGLKSARTDHRAEFTVDASEAGPGAIDISVSGPSECTVNVEDNEDGTYSVTYTAQKAGEYSINVRCAKIDVPGSPFQVICERPPPDASKCIVTGLENLGRFTVDCKEGGGSGLLEVGVSGAYVPVEFLSVKHNGDYTFSVSYDIPQPGKTIISVKWHGEHLTGSPFTVVTTK